MKKIFLLANIVLLSQSSLLLWGSSLDHAKDTRTASEQVSLEQQIDDEQENSVEFVMKEIDEKGSVSKHFVDEANVLHTVEIEESSDVAVLASSIMSLQNKTYTIKYTKESEVASSFKIDIQSNKIQRAHSNQVTLYTGTLSDSKLVRISSTKAQQTFNQKIFFVTIKYSLVASIAGGKIVVTTSP